MDLDRLGDLCLDAAFAVHRELGPGLLESVYETCLIMELEALQLRVVSQAQVPIVYRGRTLSTPLRLDLVVEETVILEVKAVDRLLPVHAAQLLTYMKLADKPLGYLLNFNTPLLRDGIRRLIRT